jgi:uncharacterized repeat protein (TIGR03809 family)
MDDQPQHLRPEELARRWRALTDRRREHFAEMYQSGRWRRYYTEEKFLAQMKATMQVAEAFETLSRVKRDDSVLEKALRTLESSDPL